MKNSLEKTSSLGRKLTFEVPIDKVSSAFERVYKGLQKNATIKGYRKGKAPLATIKSMYSDRVQQDVLEELISEAYSKALKEHELHPVAQPQVKIDGIFAESSPFKFTAEFEVRPEISLKKYEKLKVEKEKLEVSAEKVDSILLQIRQSRAQLIPVFEEREVQAKDIVDINFFGTVEGQPLQGGAADGYKLELGTNSFIPGFEDGVLGMKIGDSRVLNLSFPADYGHKDIAGKPVKFDVKLNAIMKKDLPTLTDDFVKTLGDPKIETLEALKKTISQDISQQESKRIQDDLKTKLLKELVKENPIEVPNSLRVEQKQFLIEDTRKRLKDQGMSEPELAEYVVKWDKDFSETADFMIQTSFLIDALAEKFKLAATQVDIEDKLKKYAASSGLDIHKLREFYVNNHDRKHQLRYQITEEKVVDYLIQQADIKEVEAAKLKN